MLCGRHVDHSMDVACEFRLSPWKSEATPHRGTASEVGAECGFSRSNEQSCWREVHQLSGPSHYSFIENRGEFQGCRSLYEERKWWSVANSIGRRYRYGASFVDQESGVRFEGHHPLERPDLWKVYLNEAEGIFRSRGFESTLRRVELEEGNGVSLFILAFDTDGNAVAGVRFHGPLEGSHQAAIIEEMASSPEIGMIRDLIEQEIRLGAVEIKGLWSKGATVVGTQLRTAMSRSITHGMNWLGAEFAFAAVSDMLLPIGGPTGAGQIGTQWVPFPDERYRTVAVSWNRGRTYELSTPVNQQAYRREAEQLLRGPSRSGEGPIEPASTRNRASRPLILDVGERAQREVLRILREDSALQI